MRRQTETEKGNEIGPVTECGKRDKNKNRKVEVAGSKEERREREREKQKWKNCNLARYGGDH